MAREVTVVGRCDVCGARAEPEQMLMDIPVMFGRRSGEVDLCLGCHEQAGKDVAALLDVARSERGRSRTGRKRRRDATPGGPPSSQRPRVRQAGSYDQYRNAEGLYECPECVTAGGEVWTSQHAKALGAHRAKTHAVMARRYA